MPKILATSANTGIETGMKTMVANINYMEVPVGSIQMFAGATAPTGWMLCNGQAISRADYAELFTLIGTTYGSGDGSVTFNLPNMQGKVPVGVSLSDADFDLADTGGSKTDSYTPTGVNSDGSVGGHALTVSEMPTHNHALYGALDGNNYSITNTGNGWNQTTTGWNSSTWIANAGGNGSHDHPFTQPTFTGTAATLNKLQPYLAINYIIKVV